ncbi:class I SAM-dependent methyltransferase [Nonomuraea sp. NPDC049158]|uniref:class I SAM-dependent methyltransferase n=1 Tax=Nonomuraea sp. NPDC049158 TaxID=3155649 RepID=UPI0033C7D43C
MPAGFRHYSALLCVTFGQWAIEIPFAGARPVATMIPVITKLMEHYTKETSESTRLTRPPHGRLEYLRTQELLRRTLMPPPARILDVGGGTGVHAQWLAADGYEVQLVDPVHTHVEAAAALPGVSAEVGDARHLSAQDQSADVVLLLGPIYHLTGPADRAQALAEAQRVLRLGGLVLAAVISRCRPRPRGRNPHRCPNHALRFGPANVTPPSTNSSSRAGPSRRSPSSLV